MTGRQHDLVREATRLYRLHQMISDKLDDFLTPEERNAAAFLIADMLIENGLIVDEVKD